MDKEGWFHSLVATGGLEKWNRIYEKGYKPAGFRTRQQKTPTWLLRSRGAGRDRTGGIFSPLLAFYPDSSGD